MRYRPNWLLITLGAVVVAMLFTYPAWRTAVVLRPRGLDFAEASEGQRAILNGEIRRTSAPYAATAYAALLTSIPAPTSDNPTPDGSRFQAVKGGDFMEINALQTGKGRAAILRNAINNALILRFDDFIVTGGPDLAVYLSITPRPLTAGEVRAGAYYRVSTLKGTRGNQNFDLAPELRLEPYKSVVVFSESLNIVYTYAPLN